MGIDDYDDEVQKQNEADELDYNEFVQVITTVEDLSNN
jgi:dynein heavy chain, axonemal